MRLFDALLNYINPRPTLEGFRSLNVELPPCVAQSAALLITAMYRQMQKVPYKSRRGDTSHPKDVPQANVVVMSSDIDVVAHAARAEAPAR